VKAELFYKGLSAVADTKGGELISLKDEKGREFLWQGDPAFWPGRNPLLFPVVGNLKDGKIIINGESCSMSRHGFARDMEFELVACDGREAVLELRSSAATKKLYPAEFSLEVRHRLEERGFSTSFAVTNTGDEEMLFCIGAHTAFRCPVNEGERFEDYSIVFEKEEDADMLLLTPEGLLSHEKREKLLHGEKSFSLDRALFERLDTVILEGLHSKSVSLLHKESGRGIRVDFEGFPMLAFWTKSGCEADFICIEPWHGCAAVEDESGFFEDKPHCIHLQAGESKKLCYMIIIEERN